MKKTYMMCVLLSTILTSCGTKKEPKRLIDNFDNITVAATQRIALEYDSLTIPLEMQCVEGQLYFLNDPNRNTPHLISRFDAKTGKFTGEFLTRGGGPKEFLTVWNLGKLGKWLTFNDYHTIVWCNKDLHFRKIKIEPDKRLKMMPRFYALSEDLYICDVVADSGRCAIINRQGEVIKIFNEEKNFLGQGNNVMMISNFMAYNSQKKVVAMAEGNGEWIKFYDLSNVQSPVLLANYTYIQRRPKVRQDGVFILSKDHNGTRSIQATDKYCICLVQSNADDEKEDNDQLLFFNWEGKAVKAMKLPQHYKMMAADNQYVYLLGTNPETDEYILDTVEYK